MNMRILVTGGAGFIGSAFIRYLMYHTDAQVVNVDKLTYAGDLESIACAASNPRYQFRHADICDGAAMRKTFAEFKPQAVVHFAAESHVDRSVDSPVEFMETNIRGTFKLLEAARSHWKSLPAADREQFRFLHVSTDEVFGSLGDTGRFVESTAYAPSSPYSASKAASDHLVHAWYLTYGLPTIVTNCSNNYGPFQFPEKLIPLMILNAAAGRKLPVYGSGENVRDWLHVEDHVRGLYEALIRGRPGQSYNLGGNSERRNVDVIRNLCEILDKRIPDSRHRPHLRLLTYVDDRPGHDRRYAIDSSKAEQELDWRPLRTFEQGLADTVDWYLANKSWCERIRRQRYDGGRMGLGEPLGKAMHCCPFHDDSVGVACSGEIYEISCPSCGDYRISGTALTRLQGGSGCPEGWETLVHRPLISTRDVGSCMLKAAS
jgi:dTDP-glucose 4,6-dehydratase